MLNNGDERIKKKGGPRKGTSHVEYQALTRAQKEAILSDAVEFFYRIGASFAVGILDRLQERNMALKIKEEEDFKKQ